MKFYGINVAEGSSISNLIVPAGTSFPVNENTGEIFYRTDQSKFYVYNGTAWEDVNTWLTSGSNIYRLTGKVGIGISSPNYKLQSHESTAATANYIQVTNNTTGSAISDGILFGLNTAGAGIISLQENAALNFYVNGTISTYIAADNGIVVGSPTGGSQGAGSINATSLYVNGSAVQPGAGYWTQTGSDIYYSTGNVGIGSATTPSYKLEIFGTTGISTSSATALVIGNTLGQKLTFNSSIANYATINADRGLVVNTQGGYDLNLKAASVGSVFLYTNSTARVRVDGSGLVGIGTTAPAANLDVSPSTGTAEILIQRAANSPAQLRIKNTIQEWLIGNSVAVNNEFTIRDVTDSRNVFHIDTSGNVGFGTTVPGAFVDVSKSTGAILRLTSSNAAVVANEMIGKLEFYTSDASAGEAGVGASIRAESNMILDGTGISGLDLIFATKTVNEGLTDRMKLTAGGSLGIGGTPSSKLHVMTAGVLSFQIQNTTASITSYLGCTTSIGYVGTSTSHALGIYIAGTEAARFTTTGNFGIGISPVNKLHLYESTSGALWAQFTNVTTGAGASNGFIVGIDGNEQPLLWNYSATDMAFGVNNTEAIRIKSSLLVGIGTSAPTNKLHIHESTSGACYTQFTNSTTLATATDGFLVGIDVNEKANIWNYEATDLYIGTNNTQAAYFASSGGFVVGSPTGGAQGAGTINATGVYVNGVAVSSSSQWTTTGSDIYYNTGKVAIGVAASANYKLQVHESTAATANYIQVTNNSSGSASTDGLLLGFDTSTNAIINQKENSPLYFYTNNTQAGYFAANGGLVIGSPTGGTQGSGTINATTLFNNGVQVITTGTFTPVLWDISFNDAKGQTYLTQFGQYTKINNVVFYQINIILTSKGTLNSASNAYIGNLPFIPSPNVNGHGIVTFASNLSITAGQSMTADAAFTSSSYYLILRLWSAATGTSGCPISNIGETTHLIISGFYLTT